MTRNVFVKDAVLNRFHRLSQAGKLAHAYLFTGPAQSGKSETALAVASLLLCEARDANAKALACGQCPTCLKILSGNHPDVMIMKKGEDVDSIKIEQVREMIGRLQMRSFFGGLKICIIKNIENLTTESSNALLKTLEEPHRDSLLLLTTSVPEENLKTVVSRCHLIKFSGQSPQTIAKYLVNEDGLALKQALFLSRISEGTLAQARQLAQEGFIRQKNDAIDHMVIKDDHEDYLKKILGNKEEIRKNLLVLLSWFRDLAVLKAGASQDQVIHTDRYEELLRLEKNYSLAHLNGIIDEIVNTLKMLGENLNIKIPFVLLREKIWVRL